MKVSKRNLAKTISLAVMMATTISVASAAGTLQSGDVTATINGNGVSYTLADTNVTLNMTDQATVNLVLTDMGITIGEDQTLSILSKSSDENWGGTMRNVTVNEVGKNAGKLVIKKEQYLGNALGYYGGEQSFYVNEFEATVEDGCAIYANPSDKYTIDAKKITLSGNYGQRYVDIGATANVAGIYATGEVNLQNFDELNIKLTNTSSKATEGGPALFANSNGKININGAEESVVTVSSMGRAAIVALGNGQVKIDAGVLEASSSALAGGEIRKNSVIGANGANALVDITLKNALIITGYDDDTVENAIGAEQKGAIVVKNDGIAQVDGNISSLTGGSVTVGFDGEDSYLFGKVTTDSDATTTLIFGEGAIWQNRGDSTVTNLMLSDGATWYTNTALSDEVEASVKNLISDGGVIDFGENSETEINVGTLAGSDLTIKTDSSPLLTSFTVKDASDTDIKIQAGSTFMKDYENGITELDELVDIVSIDGVIGANVSGLTVAEGLVYGEITADVVDGQVTNIVTKENKTNAGMIDMTALSLVAWRDSFDDLNSRLGDLRNNREDNGVWARFSRGETSYNSVTNQANMYQIGYDKQAGDWTVGLAYSYTDGNSTFAGGSGENTHNVVSLYGTKMNKNGTYLDLVAKYGNLDYEYDVRHQGQEVAPQGADYDVDAYAFSAEVGKRITSSNGAWVEPQFQLTYGTVDSATFMANGIKVHQNSVDSFVARAGIMAGKPFAKGDIYVRASYLYDFDGEVDGTFSNGTVSTNINRDLGGGWWEVGVGMRTNLSDATHLYLDFEKAFAGEVDTDWKWNAGVRYSF